MSEVIWDDAPPQPAPAAPPPAPASEPPPSAGGTVQWDRPPIFEPWGQTIPEPGTPDFEAAADEPLPGAAVIGGMLGQIEAARDIAKGFVRGAVEGANQLVQTGMEIGLAESRFAKRHLGEPPQALDDFAWWAFGHMPDWMQEWALRDPEEGIKALQIPVPFEAPQTTLGEFAEFAGQFGPGYSAFLRTAEGLGLAQGFVRRSIATFLAGAATQNPDAARVSNALDEVYPNFITAFLKADPNEENRILARVRSGLEYLLEGAALEGLFGTLKAAKNQIVKFARSRGAPRRPGQIEEGELLPSRPGPASADARFGAPPPLKQDPGGGSSVHVGTADANIQGGPAAPRNAVERELDRLGFKRGDYAPSTGDAEADRLIAKHMAPVIETEIEPFVDGAAYKGLSDPERARELSKRLSAARHEVIGTPQEPGPAMLENPDLFLELRRTHLSPGVPGEHGGGRERFARAPTGPYGRTSAFDATQAAWRNRVDRLLRGEPIRDPLSLGRTFTVLRELGERDKGLVLHPRAAEQIRRTHPDIPLDVWRRLPELISDPLYAYRQIDGGTAVIVDARTPAGSPILVAIRDGMVRTITPQDGREGVTGMARVLYKVGRAVEAKQRV